MTDINDKTDKVMTVTRCLPIGIRTLDVKIDYTYAKKEPLPILDETVLKLLSIHDQCSLDDIRSFLGLSTQEIKILSADLLKKNIIQISNERHNIEPLIEKGLISPDLFEYETARNKVKINLIVLNKKIKENEGNDSNKSSLSDDDIFLRIQSNDNDWKITDEELKSYFITNFNDIDDSEDEVYFHSINKIKSYASRNFNFPLKIELPIAENSIFSLSLPTEKKLEQFTDDILSYCYEHIKFISYLDNKICDPEFQAWLALQKEIPEISSTSTPRLLFQELNENIISQNNKKSIFCDLSGQVVEDPQAFSKSLIGVKLRSYLLENRVNNSFKTPKLYWKSAQILGKSYYLSLSDSLSRLSQNKDSGLVFCDLLNIGRHDVWDSLALKNYDETISILRHYLLSDNIDILFIPKQCFLMTYHLLAGEITDENKREGLYIPITVCIESKEILNSLENLIKIYQQKEPFISLNEDSFNFKRLNSTSNTIKDSIPDEMSIHKSSTNSSCNTDDDFICISDLGYVPLEQISTKEANSKDKTTSKNTFSGINACAKIDSYPKDDTVPKKSTESRTDLKKQALHVNPELWKGAKAISTLKYDSEQLNDFGKIMEEFLDQRVVEKSDNTTSNQIKLPSYLGKSIIETKEIQKKSESLKTNSSKTTRQTAPQYSQNVVRIPSGAKNTRPSEEKKKIITSPIVIKRDPNNVVIIPSNNKQDKDINKTTSEEPGCLMQIISIGIWIFVIYQFFS